MKATKGKSRIFFLALCVIALLSALAFGFATDSSPELKMIYSVLAVMSAIALLIWSLASLVRNPVRGTTGLLILLIAGFMALTVTGWQIHNRIDDMVDEQTEIIWFQRHLK